VANWPRSVAPETIAAAVVAGLIDVAGALASSRSHPRLIQHKADERQGTGMRIPVSGVETGDSPTPTWIDVGERASVLCSLICWRLKAPTMAATLSSKAEVKRHPMHESARSGFSATPPRACVTQGTGQARVFLATEFRAAIHDWVAGN
jgi:hypothetical protein